MLAAMDNPQPSQSNQSLLDSLRTVEFRLGLKGYNVDEVDEYLEKAAVEAESVQEQLRQANERLRQAQTRVAQLEEELRQAGEGVLPITAAVPVPDAGVSDDTLQRTLVMAQKFVDQIKQESETEAQDVVAKAEDRARGILAQAEERARQMSVEAEQRLREDVARLEAMRAQLSGDVEKMARHLETERTRLRSSVADMLKFIDENVQPATALAAVRPREGTPAAAANGNSGGGDEARRAAAS